MKGLQMTQLDAFKAEESRMLPLRNNPVSASIEAKELLQKHAISKENIALHCPLRVLPTSAKKLHLTVN
jgi:hypothetical protein